jgi:hypothetical protein
MVQRNKFPEPEAVNVNWDAPHLHALLQKTEAWRLDNRGMSDPMKVEIHVGWGTTKARPALIVWEDHAAMILQTTFPIASGELVQVHSANGLQARTLWGEVIRGRPGQRDDDHAQGLHILWLRLIAPNHDASAK